MVKIPDVALAPWPFQQKNINGTSKHLSLLKSFRREARCVIHVLGALDRAICVALTHD